MRTHGTNQEFDKASLRGPLGFSLASHFAFVFFALFLQGQKPLGQSHSRHRLGYEGQGPGSNQLDLLQANALHFRFFQPASGVPGSVGGPSARTGLETRVEQSTPAGVAERRPTTGGVTARRRESVRSHNDRNEAEAGNTSGDAGGSPGLQPDVAFSDEVTIVRLVKPVYPERELAAGINANILVAIHVTPNGEIDDANIREAATNPPGPTRAFEITALEALGQWRVRLPMGDEYKEGCWLLVPVEYRPDDKDFDRFDGDMRPERAPSTAP